MGVPILFQTIFFRQFWNIHKTAGDCHSGPTLPPTQRIGGKCGFTGDKDRQT